MTWVHMHDVELNISFCGYTFASPEIKHSSALMIEGLMEQREPRTFSIDKSKVGGHFSLFTIL